MVRPKSELIFVAIKLAIFQYCNSNNESFCIARSLYRYRPSYFPILIVVILHLFTICFVSVCTSVWYLFSLVVTIPTNLTAIIVVFPFLKSDNKTLSL